MKGLVLGFCLLAGTASAQELRFNSLVVADEQQWWDGFTYHSQDSLQSMNRLGAQALLYAHDRFDMEDRSPLARALFLGTAGQAVSRFQWANSIMVHEYAHFQFARSFGFEVNYFRDDEDGEIFDFSEAWVRSFFHGDPRGPAVYGDGDGVVDWVGYGQSEHMQAAAGNNLQMTYSAERVREFQFMGEDLVFMAPDMFLNRIYPTTYTWGTYLSGDKTEPTWDPGRYAAALSARTGEEEVLKKMALVGLASVMLSPSAVWTQAEGVGEYIMSGETMVTAPHYRWGDMKVSYDVPYYRNIDSVTIAPTVYALKETNAWLRADKAMIGLSFEQGVIGASDQEVWITYDSVWDKIGVSAGLAIGDEGHYSEIAVRYALNDDFAFEIAGAQNTGETLRGTRNMPTTDSLVWYRGIYSF